MSTSTHPIATECHKSSHRTVFVTVEVSDVPNPDEEDEPETETETARAPDDAGTHGCMIRVIERLRFEEPDGGICVVSFPFVFRGIE